MKCGILYWNRMSNWRKCRLYIRYYYYMYGKVLGNNGSYLYKVYVCVQLLSCVWIFANLWIVAHQAPLSMGSLKQEY